MSKRLKLTKRCPECTADFHPYHKRQTCCSASCGAAYRHRMTTDPEKRSAWCRKGQQALQAKRWKALAMKLKACKTLGDAYRLGRKEGYATGWRSGYRAGMRRRIAA